MIPTIPAVPVVHVATASEKAEHALEKLVRAVPDFPKKGILFRDITPVLQDANAYRTVIDAIDEIWPRSSYDVIAAFDARGFLFGSPLATSTGKPLALVRKAGKLPYETIEQPYGLEYGSGTLAMHTDSITPGQRVLMIDDLLATGGTMKAGCTLVERLGGTVTGCHCVVELDGLGGRNALAGYDVRTNIRYEG